MSVSDKLGTPSSIEWLIGPLINHGFVVALIAACVITPGCVLLITRFVEKRPMSLVSSGFKSFIPGDYALGLLFATSVALCDRLPEKRHQWYQSSWWHVIVIVGSVSGCLLARKFLDAPNYTKAQMWSPSKVYHDFVLYAGYGYLLCSVAIPGLFLTGWRHEPSYVLMVLWAVVLALPVAALLTKLFKKQLVRSLLSFFAISPVILGMSFGTWLQTAAFAAFLLWLGCLIYDQVFQDPKQLARTAHIEYHYN